MVGCLYPLALLFSFVFSVTDLYRLLLQDFVTQRNVVDGPREAKTSLGKVSVWHNLAERIAGPGNPISGPEALLCNIG